MIRSSLVTSRYGSPQRVRLWQFTHEGDARCLVDAPLVSSVDEATLARIDDAAALIRYGLTLAEAHEAAERVREPGEDVPLTVPTYDPMTGEETGTEPHPQWQAYQDAQAVIASATPDLLHLVTLRRGAPPEEYEADGTTPTGAWADYLAARARLAESCSSIMEDAPPLTSPDARPAPASPPDFLP